MSDLLLAFYSRFLRAVMAGGVFALMPEMAHAAWLPTDTQLTAIFLFIFALMAVLCLFLLLRIWNYRHPDPSEDPELQNLVVSASVGGYYYWEARRNHSEFSLNLARMLNLRNDVQNFEQAVPLFGKDADALLKEYNYLKEGKKNSFLINLRATVLGEEKHFQCSANRIIDPVGRTRGVILWFFDISEYITEFDHIIHQNAHLRKELTLYTDVLNALPMPVWEREADLSIRYCNAAYSRFVAESPDSDEKRLNIYEGALALAQKTKDSGHVQKEREHLIVGGKRRLFEIEEIPVDGGASFAGYAKDISAIEKAEKELELHISAQAELLESSSSAMAIYGPDRRLKFYNNAFCKLWKLEEKWLNQNPTYGEVLEVLRENRRLPEQADFREFRKQQMQFFTDLINPYNDFFYLPDGTALRVIVIPHALGGLLFSYEDMTDRLAIERSYNTLIAVQRATLDNLKEGVGVFGEDGRIKLFNPQYTRIWGYDPEKLKREPHIVELLDESRKQFKYGRNWEKFRDELVADTAIRESRTQQLELKDGRVLERTTVPLPDGGTLVSYVDITDSMLVERSLRERNEALEEADRVKTEFLANVSYELRTPLTSVLGLSEALQQRIAGDLNSKQYYYVENIYKSANQLMSLINDILDLSSMGAGQLTLDVHEFDIYSLLMQMQEFMAESYKDMPHAPIKLECEQDIGAMLGDEKRIRQVVLNLVSNALKFTPRKGKITLGAKQVSRGEIMIWVEDSGVGIQPEDKEKVFDRFYKTPWAWENNKSGAGLGLSVARSIVELHDGRIRLESTPDKGTKVVCYFKRRNAKWLADA